MTLLPCAVDGRGFDENILDLAAIAAGVHLQRAADSAGHAAQEFQSGNARIRRRPRDAASSAAAPARKTRAIDLELPKAAGRRTTTPWMPPSRTRRLEPTPMMVTAQIRRFRRQKSRQIVGIGGTEKNFRRTAGAEPDEILQRRVLA